MTHLHPLPREDMLEPLSSWIQLPSSISQLLLGKEEVNGCSDLFLQITLWTLFPIYQSNYYPIKSALCAGLDILES